MKLYEIMKQTTCEVVLSELSKRCSVDQDEVKQYAGVYRRLREMKPCGSGMTVVFDDTEGEARIICGKDVEGTFFAAWPNWLGADLECFTSGPCSADTIVAACMVTMTEFGFGEEDAFACLSKPCVFEGAEA